MCWKSWNWPSYSRECFLYRLRRHLAMATSSLTVRKPKSASQYYPWGMWRNFGSLCCSWSSVPTNYMNSHWSGLRSQNTAITGHSSPHRMCGPSSSMSWKFGGHSCTELCGCRNSIPVLCITSSLFTMTCSIRWMAWCKLWPRRRDIVRKIYTLPWSLGGRSRPNSILKSPQRLVCFSIRNISLILARSCYCLGSGTREWILILKTRLLILPYTMWPCWSMWRTNTALSIDICWSQNPKP